MGKKERKRRNCPGVGRKSQERREIARELGERARKEEKLPKSWAEKLRKKKKCPGAGRKSRERRKVAQEVGGKVGEEEKMPGSWAKE